MYNHAGNKSGGAILWNNSDERVERIIKLNLTQNFQKIFSALNH